MSSRERILAKAIELIHSRGIHNTSIQDILDATSVTRSNLYYHFQSKEQLTFEVLAEQMRRFYAMVLKPSLEDPDLDPARRIDAFLDRLLDLGRSQSGAYGCPFGNVAQEVSSTHEALRRCLSLFFQACTDALESCLREGEALGRFRQGLPHRQMAEFILAQVQGAFLLRKTHRDPDLMRRNFEILRDTIGRWRLPDRTRPPGEPAGGGRSRN